MVGEAKSLPLGLAVVAAAILMPLRCLTVAGQSSSLYMNLGIEAAE